MHTTFDDFMALVTTTFPGASVGEDNDGQLVIYTNLRVGEEGGEAVVRNYV